MLFKVLDVKVGINAFINRRFGVIFWYPKCRVRFWLLCMEWTYSITSLLAYADLKICFNDPLVYRCEAGVYFLTLCLIRRVWKCWSPYPLLIFFCIALHTHTHIYTRNPIINKNFDLSLIPSIIQKQSDVFQVSQGRMGSHFSQFVIGQHWLRCHLLSFKYLELETLLEFLFCSDFLSVLYPTLKSGERLVIIQLKKASLSKATV